MQRIAVLVPSCDHYSDLWLPFFTTLRQQWPDIPFELVLVTNHKDFTFRGVTVIRVGEDKGWCANLKLALSQIGAEAILLFVDDLFINRRVDSVAVERLFRRFLLEGMNYLRFNPTPGPTERLDADGIGEVCPGDYYRASTVVSLWRKTVLQEVLRDNETAWELEIVGSSRTRQYGGWFASSRWLIPTTNLVIKGRYDPFAFWRLRRTGLSLSDHRPRMSGVQYMRFLGGRVRARLFHLMVPGAMRQRVRQRFRGAVKPALWTPPAEAGAKEARGAGELMRRASGSDRK